MNEATEKLIDLRTAVQVHKVGLESLVMMLERIAYDPTISTAATDLAYIKTAAAGLTASVDAVDTALRDLIEMELKSK